MKAGTLLSLLLVIAAWQVEMAVEAGIAARRRKPKPVVVQSSSPQPQCSGPSCPLPQQPQPVIRIYRR
jgi:hypothetical protein